MDWLGVDQMVVIKNKDNSTWNRGDLVDYRGQDCLSPRRLRGLKRTQHPFSNIRRYRLQSSDEVSQKAYGVVIPIVQRQPGGWTLATGDPFADQSGLAKARRGRDESQFSVQTSVQMLDQTLAVLEFWPGVRDKKFGCEERGGHILSCRTTG